MREFKDIKVAVAGTGYVGLSIAILLSQHHHVTAVDVIPRKGRETQQAYLAYTRRIYREVSRRETTQSYSNT